MRACFVLSLLVLAGCGSSAPKAAEPKPEPSAAPAESSSAEAKPVDPEEATSKKIPAGCDGDDKKACVMPRGFVRNLCSGAYPELALMFFQKGSPWRRAYVAVKEAAPFNGL